MEAPATYVSGLGTGLEVEERPSAPPEAAPTEEAAFDTAKAARYSVANLGTAQVWALFTSAMPLYLSGYGLNPMLIGLLSNERSFVGALAQPIVGRISDRTRTPLGRRRPFFLVGVPLMCLALAILATHPPFWTMLGIMTVASFFLFIAVDPYVAMMADLFPVEQRGRVGGFTGMATAMGALTLVGIAFLFWQHNEPVVFGLAIIILLATWGFTFFTVKEPALPPRAEVEAANAARPRARNFASRLSTARHYISGLMQYPEAVKYTIAMTLFWLGNGGATPYVTLFGTQALGVSETESYLLVVGYLVVTVAFAIPAGYIADRIGKKKVLTVGLLIYGMVAIIGSQSPTLSVAVAALALIGVGNACATAILVPFFTDMIPHKRCAELVGLYSALTSLVQPIGSVIAGGVVFLVAGMGPKFPESLYRAGTWALNGTEGTGAGYRWSFIVAGTAILIATAILQTVNVKRAVQQAQVEY